MDQDTPTDVNLYAFGEKFETTLVEWLAEENIKAVRTQDLYGKASESINSASQNKSQGDVLLMGTPILIECKRGYFVAKNYDKTHPFKGWIALTNTAMEKDRTVMVPAGVIKSWIAKKAADKEPKWDKSSIGNEGVKFDPEYRKLNASKTWKQFVEGVKDGSIRV